MFTRMFFLKKKETLPDTAHSWDGSNRKKETGFFMICFNGATTCFGLFLFSSVLDGQADLRRYRRETGGWKQQQQQQQQTSSVEW